MNEQRIREIANESSYHAENSVDYYSGIVDGLTWEAKILKVRDLKFAELIVRECAKFLDENSGYDYSMSAWHPEPEEMLQHFGIEK